MSFTVSLSFSRTALVVFKKCFKRYCQTAEKDKRRHHAIKRKEDQGGSDGMRQLRKRNGSFNRCKEKSVAAAVSTSRRAKSEEAREKKKKPSRKEEYEGKKSNDRKPKPGGIAAI
jgi:hypothetical protein